jgi:hypothetical protein
MPSGSPCRHPVGTSARSESPAKYVPDVSESKLYAGLVWGLVVIGIVVISAGFSQPIVLAVIAAAGVAYLLIARPHQARR